MSTSIIAIEEGRSIVETRSNPISEDPKDPQVLLNFIEQREDKKDSLFLVSPLSGINQYKNYAKQTIYEAIGLKLGLNINHLFQWLSTSLPKEPRWGTTTDMDFVGSLDVMCKGKPQQGQLFFGLEGRWDYGTTGPTDLGKISLGSLIHTANAFAAYDPTFLLRNFYWQQGSKEAGWVYRIGKITPDSIISISSYLSSTTTFLTTAGTNSFANALPDSGLGVAAVWLVNDRVLLGALVSDANGNRSNWGDIEAGDFYKAIELDVKIAPKTANAPYSKITLWHTDGTKNGLPINGSSGRKGWGVFVNYQQELTNDGRAIGILKWGKSFNHSAFYDEQAGAYFLLFDPIPMGRLKNTLWGIDFNWAKASEEGTQNEYNVETFFRFPIFPFIDMTLSYQSVIHPALAPEIDHASAYSLRLRSTF